MESITSTLKYDQYSDSGYEWIGEIPEHWDLVKLGSCLSPVSVKNCPELPLLSITREQGVIERDVDDKESNHNFIPDDLSGYKKLEKGQFGMNKMKAWQGSYGVSKFTGIVSPAYFIFDFTKAINPEFFNWAIRSKLYVSFFGSASDGVRIGQWDLSKARMKVIPFVLPSEEEQSLIANFLDKKTAQIDDAIAIKEQQISLLKERKQIIVHQAVTRGLDPNVSMKDSEVEWIGKIPEHWDLVKLGSCLSPVSVKNCPELPLLSITREQGVIERDVDDKESNHNFIPDDLSGYKKLEKGQFGMNKMKAWQGSYGVSKFTGIVSPAYFIFDFTKAINPEFFNWAIRSKLYVSFFGSASDGVRIGQWDLSKARMKVIPFVLPCEEEQLLIAKHLDEKLEQVDVAIKIKRQQIERLREYKSSLINSAVTGKFKITPEMVEQ
ncbi:restriction endonuclease subunit S [Vibrio parahaemolyticus]|uniref:restriction endonuclease subunit S n=1 Tax=Vibrio parahaemolyticus TaxID=670 RepID=UPI0018696EFF|nr:restriction endonuclease subunit S [Vibrio parahaemolyticus]MBE3690258.1 restriction endonuclease subunit S [Vibrio parahaemolyticus]MBE3771483.1 restriction endonuclease subunit S [Vibrio parahaemolyticus]MBE3806740.1 restriction endonuclease subunit S [Vibrio parahaemolyticus]MCX8951247.1 restriction endonuclease subunit S [Vibrio parahaemolyticus]MDF5493846.1 restriction endonuclease subunit S [Vibrio parahaemolyticus]